MNARNPATRRIKADVKELAAHPSSRYYAEPLEDNMFEWHFTIRGPPDTAFEGGVYHGRILLPAEYPFKPPNIVFLTKNGRFEVGTKICLSISAYHEESWQPAWGVRTMLEAIISFLPSEGAGAIGALDWTPEERKKLAKESLSYVCPHCGLVKDLLSDPQSTADDKATAVEVKKESVGKEAGDKDTAEKRNNVVEGIVHGQSPSVDDNKIDASNVRDGVVRTYSVADAEIINQIAQLHLTAPQRSTSPYIQGHRPTFLHTFSSGPDCSDGLMDPAAGCGGASPTDDIIAETVTALGNPQETEQMMQQDLLPDMDGTVDDLEFNIDAVDNVDNMEMIEEEDPLSGKIRADSFTASKMATLPEATEKTGNISESGVEVTPCKGSENETIEEAITANKIASNELRQRHVKGAIDGETNGKVEGSDASPANVPTAGRKGHMTAAGVAALRRLAADSSPSEESRSSTKHYDAIMASTLAAAAATNTPPSMKNTHISSAQKTKQRKKTSTEGSTSRGRRGDSSSNGAMFTEGTGYSNLTRANGTNTGGRNRDDTRADEDRADAAQQRAVDNVNAARIIQAAQEALEADAEIQREEQRQRMLFLQQQLAAGGRDMVDEMLSGLLSVLGLMIIGLIMKIVLRNLHLFQ